MRPRTDRQDLRPEESKRLLKLLVLPIGLIFASVLYAVSTNTPFNGSSPVFIDNDLADIGSLMFVAVIAYFTGKSRARTEARAGADSK
jgi:multisubunit Na+/H+ antiporter MnhB subunit